MPRQRRNCDPYPSPPREHPSRTSFGQTRDPWDEHDAAPVRVPLDRRPQPRRPAAHHKIASPSATAIGNQFGLAPDRALDLRDAAQPSELPKSDRR